VPRIALLAALTVAFAAAAPAAFAGPATGRLLVLLDRDAATGPTARAAAARAVVASTGARRSGHSVPQIGLVTVRPRAGESLSALAERLRDDPRVGSVQLERRHTLREVPDDPALTTAETAPGTPPGTVVQWWAARQFLPEAWDITHGEDAVVAVIDQGIDATHPEFAGRIRSTIDLDDDAGSGPPTTDANGHGTHVASMACATAGNGIGFAGAGYGCSLIVIKSDLTDSSIAEAIVRATDDGAHAINMSFGQDGRERAPDSQVRAIDYAYDRDVVLVAAAADQAVTEQGDPANALQPTGTGPTLESGKGLSVTAADYDDDRAPFAGFGTQISLAAYGSFHYRPAVPAGPNGIFGAFPAGATAIESDFPPCNCRTTFGGDNRYGYLQGTSMAAPMVAAVAALLHDVNPGLRAADKIELIKQTATRPAGTGWNADLGWGILNAGAAVAAARTIDRTRPVSRLTAPKRVEGRRFFRLRWTGRDPAPAGLPATGIARYEVWRRIGKRKAKRIAVTAKSSLRLRGTPTRTYSFYTRAVDNAGNREGRPRRPDARTRVVRP
jgi:serine protease